MIRMWGTVVWALVGAIAAAVAVEALLIRDAAGGGAGAVAGAGARAVSTIRADAAGLRLNEILAGPARDWDGDGLYDSRNDEWLEVQNQDVGPVALEEYRITDADRTVRFAFTGTLAPGEVRLLTGSAAVAWQRAQGLTAAGLSLNNSGDTVYLLRVIGPDTTTVDAHAYGSIEGGSDRSVGRSSSIGEDWILFDSLNRYTGSGTPPGTGCAPFLLLQAKVPRTQEKPVGYTRYPATIGQHIRRTRIDQGLSRAELAARLSVHPETIRFWETGRTKPAVRLYPWVLAFLGYDLEGTALTIGAAVLRRRRQLGLSQRELARMLRIAPSTVWRVESRRFGPDRRTLRKLRAWVTCEERRPRPQ